MKNLRETANLDLRFVAVTKPGHGWKSSDEHVVRSHAMRHVRRKQKQKPVESRKKIADKVLIDESSRGHCDNRFVDLQRRQPSEYRLTAQEYRLLDHISNFYSPLLASKSEKFVLWIQGVKQ